jgi:hypothetical protein
MPSASSLIEPRQDAFEVQSHSSARIHALVLVIVWAISVGYMATHLKRGWVPHDEGTLGLSAERVLNGSLPHRDFDDYTGGLTFVHAIAFRELGISSVSMRIVLFVVFVTWVPAVFYIASRFGTAYSAGAVTLLAITWSVPNYPGPLPSWYNLFFATFGTAAILRYLEAGTCRWLLLAGLCAGLSALAKITAAYFVAGALLFFIFREQSITNELNRQLPVRARWYSAAITLGLAVFLALLFSLIHKVSGASGLIYFVLPACGLVGLLLAREFAGIAGRDRQRFIALMRLCVPFVVGIAIPLIAFLAPYVRTGSVRDLVHGLVATPARAIRFEAFAPESPITMLTIVPFVLPVIVAYECRRLGRAICGCILAVSACAVLFLSARYSLIYSFGWSSLATAIPVLIVGGLAILWISRGQQNLSPIRQQQIMLMICVTALCSLVQFPFASPVYFFYVAPLVILSAMALFASTVHPPRFVLGALIGFYLLFAVLWVTPSFVYWMGAPRSPNARFEQLTLARVTGLSVESSDAHLYEKLIPLIQLHSAGKFIYAAPDCPEVYFFSGLQSPTRHYFDFAEDPVGHTNRILHSLESLNVNVVTINRNPQFSGPMAPDLEGALEQRYPHLADMGRFQVRWKE